MKTVEKDQVATARTEERGALRAKEMEAATPQTLLVRNEEEAVERESREEEEDGEVVEGPTEEEEEEDEEEAWEMTSRRK